MQPQEVLETSLYVDDLDEAERFYTQVLGLKVLSRAEGRHLFFRLRRQMLLVFNPQATRVDFDDSDELDIPPHGAIGAGHVAFTASDAELELWRRRLAEHHTPIEAEVHWPHGAHSLYFRDPAGNSLEFATRNLWFDEPR